MGSGHVSDICSVLKSLLMLGKQLGTTILPTLGQSDIQRLRTKKIAIQIDRFFGFFGCCKAHKPEALGVTRAISHNFSTGYLTKLAKGFFKTSIVDGIIQILDIEVDPSSILGQALIPLLFEMLAQNLLTLALSLGTINVQVVAVNLLAVKSIDSIFSWLAIGKTHEAKALRFAFRITHDAGTLDFSVLREELVQVFVRHILTEILNVTVIELRFSSS